MKGTLAVGAALAASLVSVPAFAELTSFATYTQQDTSSTSLVFKNNGTGTATNPANNGTSGTFGTSTNNRVGPNPPKGVEVYTNFVPTGLSSVQAAQIANLSTTFTLSSHVTTAATTFGTGPGAIIDQTGLAGSFDFIYDGPDVTLTGKNIIGGSFTIKTGDDLLHGDFSDGIILGQKNSTSPTASDSTTAGGLVTYKSSLYAFTNNVFDFSLSMSALKSFGAGGTTQGLTANTGAALKSFTASSTGIFSADPAPKFIFTTAATPEPGTWAIMIVGFGVVGAVARSRKFGGTLRFA